MRKLVCNQWKCGWSGPESEFLRAPDPFNPGSDLVVCPKCRIVESTLVVACDYGDCKEPASNGSPTANGYVQRCWTHRPDEIKQVFVSRSELKWLNVMKNRPMSEGVDKL